MKDVDAPETDFPQEIELEGQGAWRIFPVDVVKDLLAVIGASYSLKIVSVALPHKGVYCRMLMRDKVCYPDTATGSEQAMDFSEGGLPFLFTAQMVQDCGSKDHIIKGFLQRDTSEVSLKQTHHAFCLG